MSKPEDSPEIRKVMLEIGQAADRARFEVKKKEKKKRQNPLFVLWVIGRYRTNEDLPLWVREWLLDLARKMLSAAMYWPARDDQPEHNPTFEEAKNEVLKAFGMTKKGWSAVEEFHQFLNDDMVAWSHEELGVPTKTLAKALGVQPRQVRARINRAKAKWPRIR